MFQSKFRGIVVVIGLAVVLVSALTVSFLAIHPGSAHATPPMSITITTTIDFSAPVPSGTFVAPAPLCPMGTFTDDIKVLAASQFLVDKTLVCGDGSGTFTIQFHPQFVRPREGIGGPWVVLSGTGAYATLRGSGNYTVANLIPDVSANEIFTGGVHFD